MHIDIYNSDSKIDFGEERCIQNNELDYVKKFIDSYDSLELKEKYELLNHFFSFELEGKDFIELINMKHDRNYTRMIDIPTKMESEYKASEGHGRDFNSWTVKIRTYLVCAVYDDFKLEKTKYSYDDIKELIECKKIYPIDSYGVEIGKYSKDKEDYKAINKFIGNEIEIYKSHYSGGYNFNVKDEDIPLIMEYINKNITKDDIFKGVKTYLKEYIKRFGLNPLDYEMLPELKEYYNNNFKNKKEKVKKL